MLNATDMSQGSRFTFLQSQFDVMCDDLDQFSLGRAVAASSNFPIAFQAMTLDNYAGNCGYQLPDWVVLAEGDIDNNLGRYKTAEVFRTYQYRQSRPHIHLLDGGVADNLGLRGPIQAITSDDTEFGIKHKINTGKIKKLLVITVDARSQVDLTYDSDTSPPGLVDVLTAVTSTPIDNLSFETTQILRQSFTNWNKDKNYYADCQNILQHNCPSAKIATPAPNIPDLEFIYIGFDMLKDPDERYRFFNIPTTFSLSENDINDVRAVAGRLLDDSKSFKKFVNGLSN